MPVLNIKGIELEYDPTETKHNEAVIYDRRGNVVTQADVLAEWRRIEAEIEAGRQPGRIEPDHSTYCVGVCTPTRKGALTSGGGYGTSTGNRLGVFFFVGLIVAFNCPGVGARTITVC